jgi:hypothetical protein
MRPALRSTRLNHLGHLMEDEILKAETGAKRAWPPASPTGQNLSLTFILMSLPRLEVILLSAECHQVTRSRGCLRSGSMAWGTSGDRSRFAFPNSFQSAELPNLQMILGCTFRVEW